ncbi:GNAT family N-acetyltransferase [Blastococcus sp. CT_GayMR20]|uniref:GNAT family N-acetyltransferase n=1 Tax=Blastococcus sp. CT_GayMR20 TaxID=2559609 RepID=UPI001073714A|nr:GNAT family N-acetyltransferase [Blastococcus sp. CT_GayMR20]TFV71370.1 GNAT family N-acetyltransferase [Blastococcus sp. CT_GayMR20]TFV71375.1 GNAT family N-acetyltransferase [Blastococcus sp. CT_GayMR20]
MSSVTVDEVPAGETYALRGAVLRPNGGEVTWPGDEDPATFHLAARTPDGRVVGVVRFSPTPCPWRPLAKDPWQLRGMATETAVRGSGAGRALLDDGLARVTTRGGDLVWCDARVTAAGFYERAGFTVVTEPYDKPGIGPHVGMLIDLPAAGASRSS